MKDNQERTAPTALILAQDIVRFGGMQLSYSLRVKQGVPSNVYEICVSKSDERTTVFAGESLDFAFECYRRIIDGIVTPCTLEDVMRDFEYSRIKLKKYLYKHAFL